MIIATGQDEAVRRYLNSLSDPAKLVDAELAGELHEAIDAEKDTIERVMLREQLVRVEDVDGMLRDAETAFLAVIKEWASGHSISPSALRAEGVPEDVLRRAGLVRQPRAGENRGVKAGDHPRRSRTTVDEIIAAMPSYPFSVSRLRDLTAAALATVRKAISIELDAGRLERAGADVSHKGPGRTAALYQRTAE